MRWPLRIGILVVAFVFIATLSIQQVTRRAQADTKIESSSSVAQEKTAPVSRPICEGWPKPDFVFFITGRQHGYIEPCGCTGLDSQKGGLARRQTLYRQLKDKGWDVVPIDVGNQVRRFGPQAAIKFQTTLASLKAMNYQAIGLGPDDLGIDSGELISEIVNDTPLVSCNISLPLLGSTVSDGRQIVNVGKHRIGITSILGKKEQARIRNEDYQFLDPVASATAMSKVFDQSKCHVRILLSHASTEETMEIMTANEDIKKYRIVISAGGADEPALKPQQVKGTRSFLIQTGKKGMYVGLLGIFAGSDTPIRYERVALDSRFKDSDEMLESLKVYQDRLKDAYQRDWNELGLRPVAHPSGNQFVGSEACGECHDHAFDVWSKTPHHKATAGIAFPTERSSIPRHFDPECLSCHVTGWSPRDYYPYASGYESFEKSKHLHGNGCENCHGPGSAHVAAENGEGDYTAEQIEQIKQAMILPLSKAEEHCRQCHDQDNDPNFQKDGAFEEYWEKIKHYEDE